MKYTVWHAVLVGLIGAAAFQAFAWMARYPVLIPIVLLSAGLGFLLFLYMALLTVTVFRRKTGPAGKLRFLRSLEHPMLVAYAGYEEDYQKYFHQLMPGPEVIIGSAIRHPDGTVYAADCPARHHHVIRHMAELGQAGHQNLKDQGFLTNHGRYVDRVEGFVIASTQNQIIEKSGNPDTPELYSEDVWQGPLVPLTILEARARDLIKTASEQGDIVVIETYPTPTKFDPESISMRATTREGEAKVRWRLEEQRKLRAELTGAEVPPK